MYSDKLQDFIDQNKPVEIVFSANKIIELAAKAGLAVFKHGDNTDELSVELLPGEIAVVSFGQESSEPLCVKRAGFFGYRVATGRKRRYAWITKFSAESTVHWSISVDGTTLRFSPYLYGKGGSIWGDATDPTPVVLEKAGIGTIEVPLPEPAVELPLPPWDNSYAVDWWGSGMISDSLVCFQSEAPAIVAPFIERLQKLLE